MYMFVFCSSGSSSSSSPTTNSDNINDNNNNMENMARAILDYDSSAFRVDDCEVFECKVASAGRQAYDFVRRMGVPSQDLEQAQNINPPLLT